MIFIVAGGQPGPRPRTFEVGDRLTGHDELELGITAAILVMPQVDTSRSERMAPQARKRLGVLPASIGGALTNLAASLAGKTAVNLNFTTKLPAVALVLHRKSGAVKHEPRGFLGHAKRPVKFPGRDTVPIAGDHPDSWKPLVQPKGRIFKDSSGLE